MDPTRDIGALLAAFRAGEPWAAEELYARFGPTIRANVRRRLPPQLRSRFDSVDFVQDVWASFLIAPSEGRAFTSPQALASFLARVAHNKVVEMSRQQLGTQKYDRSREVPAAGAEPPDRAPSPSQVVIADERWERLLQNFSGRQRVVAERLRDGYGLDDIVRLTDVSLSTVNRIVRRLKDLAGV
ncbi:ECF-type sigma factor [Gemmata sp. JC673]|uniref:ECF-type sigma factor n=1 Tax=Gemmata algarum TaxID=2975278 RepID=A0ABU5EYD4_9BACT|nr:sigma-70 family RNA polymerase sigma factor [Gemmata algarum]MDY3559472.1 ECF-type sigma factor [Gemmata algarum]